MRGRLSLTIRQIVKSKYLCVFAVVYIIKSYRVTVIEQIPGVRPVSIGQDYVLFARLGADRGAAVAGGPAGMFQINGDQLIPRAEDSTPLTEDLSQKFGLSLDQLSAYLRNGH